MLKYRSSRLHRSSEYKFLEKNTHLLETFPDIDYILHRAARSYRTELLSFLIKHTLFDPTCHDNYLLYWAVNERNLDLIDKILNDERIMPQRYDSPGQYGKDLLTKCVDSGCLSLLKRVLNDPRVNPNLNDGAAFKLVIQRNLVDLLQAFLSHPEVDPSAFNNYALRIACKRGHDAIVRILLQDSRVDPSHSNNAAFFLAVKHVNLNIVKMMIDHPNINTFAICQGISIACAFDHNHLYEFMLSHHRVDINGFANFICKNLFIAGSFRSIYHLLSHSNIDLTFDDYKVLDFAINRRNPDLIERLLCIIPEIGNSPRYERALEKASLIGDVKIVLILLRKRENSVRFLKYLFQAMISRMKFKVQ
jgi:ankyrin repeat protein